MITLKAGFPLVDFCRAKRPFPQRKFPFIENLEGGATNLIHFIVK